MYLKITTCTARAVTKTTITTTRTAMTATYGVSESCVDLNTPNNLKIYLKNSYILNLTLNLIRQFKLNQSIYFVDC